MPDSPDPAKQAQTRRDIIRAYKSIFATVTGKVVLEDLQHVFGWHRPTSAEANCQPTEVFRRESMKVPLYHIQQMLDCDLGPEADAQKPKQAKSGSPT